MTGDWVSRLMCINSREAPGELREAAPTGTCRNFRRRQDPPLRVEPPAPAGDAIRHIQLTKGKYALVDAADYEWLSAFRWHAKCSRGRYYAATMINGKSVTMHRLLMNPPPGMVVDHIDGNSLNYCCGNLRNCTPAQNRHNTRPCGKSCPFVGVRPHGDKWRASIVHDGKKIHLGDFDDPIAAALARDEAARQYQGEFAWLNFPDGPPPESDKGQATGDKQESGRDGASIEDGGRR